MPIATVNPANGETLKTFEALGSAEIEHRLATADTTFREYRTTAFGERARLLNRAADLLDEDQQDIARTMTTEMGKPIKAARAEAAKCAKAMRWYAANAEDFSRTSTRPPTTYATPEPPGPMSTTVRWARSSP